MTNPKPDDSAKPGAAALCLQPAPDGGCATEATDDGASGFVHSHDTASGVDGPGLRYVVWLMGCYFRCQYCHNPDTWTVPTGGERRRVEEVLQEVERYRGFLAAAGGGFTVSGGEPLVQAPFAMALLRGAQRVGLHTALDTNGYLGEKLTDDDLSAIDLVLLDLKAHEDQQHRRVTGVSNQKVLAFAERLAALRRPAWVRFVLVPGLTDDPTDVRRLADYVAEFGNVQRLEVLPFHQLGRDKWGKLGAAYPLEATPPADHDSVAAVEAVFRQAGCPVC